MNFSDPLGLLADCKTEGKPCTVFLSFKVGAGWEGFHYGGNIGSEKLTAGAEAGGSETFDLTNKGWRHHGSIHASASAEAKVGPLKFGAEASCSTAGGCHVSPVGSKGSATGFINNGGVGSEVSVGVFTFGVEAHPIAAIKYEADALGNAAAAVYLFMARRLQIPQLPMIQP